MDAFSAFSQAKAMANKKREKAWQIPKLPGETDEEFRERKERERMKRKYRKGMGSSEADNWASLEE